MPIKTDRALDVLVYIYVSWFVRGEQTQHTQTTSSARLRCRSEISSTTRRLGRHTDIRWPSPSASISQPPSLLLCVWCETNIYTYAKALRGPFGFTHGVVPEKTLRETARTAYIESYTKNNIYCAWDLVMRMRDPPLVQVIKWDKIFVIKTVSRNNRQQFQRTTTTRQRGKWLGVFAGELATAITRKTHNHQIRESKELR